MLNWAIALMSRVFANGPGVQSQIESYQRLKKKKWFLMLPCLRDGSRVKWNNPGKVVEFTFIW